MYMQKRAGLPYRTSEQHISVPDMAENTKKRPNIRITRRKILFGTAVTVISVLCIVMLNLAFDGSTYGMTRISAVEPMEYTSHNAAFERYKQTASIQLAYKGGEPMTISTHQITVSELLDTLGIIYDEDDLINYPLDTVVSENMNIAFDEVTYTETTEEKTLVFETVKNGVDTIPKGSEDLVRKGQNGSSEVVYRNRLINGDVASREVISEKVVKQPISEIRNVGVGGTYKAADGNTYAYSHYIDVSATAYGPNDGSSSNRTATGAKATRGVIAVDPDVIPLHAKVYVAGDYGDYGVNFAEDVGGGINGNRIDICMDCSLEEMLQFGVRKMRVYILEK